MAQFDRHGNPPRFSDIPRLGRVCRLGLATRGTTQLTPDDVLLAVERGVNYLNWCGSPNGMRDAIRELGKRRGDVFVAIQFEARTADEGRRELDRVLEELNTDYIDAATYYYAEHPDEWAELLAPGGAAEMLERARDEGRVRAIGLTTHQRPLAATVAASGRLDLLMVRYNAAHRGAELDVFPIAIEREVPVVAFTCMRWGALIRSTPEDPAGFEPPAAQDWYRFVLSHPAVAVALMAPNGGAELRENLRLIDDWRGLREEQYAALAAHGERVRRHAGGFP